MAGAGYKLFNTGDVLTAAQVNTYLMEQTVMVFANAAARTTALSGVVSEGMISYLKDTNAVEVYDGSNWVSSDDPNAIQNTIVDAKGDLISASAADTPARLAVGNNGETLVADSSTSTGLKWGAPNSIGCALYNSTTQAISTGTATALTWDSEYYDSHGFHSTSSNTSRITIPTGLGGKYLITGVFAYGLSATGSRDTNFRINGNSYRYWPQLLGSSVIYVGPSASYVVTLAAGDYIEIVTTQNSGGTLNAFTGYENGNFAVSYLGA